MCKNMTQPRLRVIMGDLTLKSFIPSLHPEFFNLAETRNSGGFNEMALVPGCKLQGSSVLSSVPDIKPRWETRLFIVRSGRIEVCVDGGSSVAG